MSLIDIEDVINLGNFATMHRWELTFLSQPSAYNGPSLNGINARCEVVTPPKRGATSVEVVIRGHKVKQPGLVEYGNQITLTLFETTDMYVTKVIKAWKELIWQTRTGITRPKSELTCDIRITRFDESGNFMYAFELKNCYLEDYEHGNELDASTAEAQKPTMILSFDYFTEAGANTQLRGSQTAGGKTPTLGGPSNFS